MTARPPSCIRHFLLMSPMAHTTQTSPEYVAFPPPPPGTNYIAVIKPCLTYLLLMTVWTSMLIPIIIVLFLFSTSSLRRKPVFILCVLIVSMGIAEGIISMSVMTRVIILPTGTQNPNLYEAFGILTFLIPFTSEAVLLVRLLAVYPPSRLPLKASLGIYVPLSCLKVARLINVVFVFKDQHHTFHSSRGDPLGGVQVGLEATTGIKVNWVLQVVDDSYSSSLFLWRLREGRRLAVVGRPVKSSYSAKLQSLFWIAVSNFVFPVVMSLTQLITLLVDSNPLIASYISVSNIYVEIICVLFATIWTARNNWMVHDASDDGSDHSVPGIQLSRISFRPNNIPHITATTVSHTLSVAASGSGVDGSHSNVAPMGEFWKPSSFSVGGTVNGSETKVQTLC
ncbi:hypothetical protein K474DRAFT_1669036 [Panus rudis PR-1116 ss-1]|nr:hypothetical protein K474DRAFT_1669036 [Panus rudis PR-1116 ss-1]